MASNVAHQNWYDFAQDTSMHGLRNATTRTSSVLRRIIWLLCTVVSVSYFLYAASTFLHGCSQKLLSTRVVVKQVDSVKFPTMTVCNQNLMHKQKLDSVARYLPPNAMDNALRDLYGGDVLPPPPDKYNKSDPTNTWLYISHNTAAEAFLYGTAHSLTESITDCKIFGHTANCSGIFKVVRTDGGICYQFNTDGTLDITAAGKTGGIQFILDAQVEQYTVGPNSEAEGFSLTFHDSHEVPLVSELSVAIQPGVVANVVLHKSEIIQHPPPADKNRSKCFHTESNINPLVNYRNYSRSGCLVECKARYTIGKCGCLHGFQPDFNNTQTCTMIELLYCSQPANNEFASDLNGLSACRCPDPCIYSEYIPTISTYSWPNERVAAMYYPEMNLTYMKKNMMKVNVFYGKISYTRLEEDLAYGIIDAIANVGGTLGLCIGASFLTIFEFMEYGILYVTRCLHNKKKQHKTIKVQPSVVCE